MVYLAIRCRRSHPKVTNMLAYGVIISQAACDYSSERWLQYDRKFRELAGARKDASWNQLNVGLWNRCLAGRSSIDRWCNECLQSGHPSWECPSIRLKKGGAPKKRPLGGSPGGGNKHHLCYKFNNHGQCDKGKECHFVHQYISCGEDHPQIACKVKRRN